MKNIKQLLKNKKYADVLQITEQQIDDKDSKLEEVRTLYHKEEKITLQHSKKALEFYKLFSVYKQNMQPIQTMQPNFSDNNTKHQIFNENYSLPHFLLFNSFPNPVINNAIKLPSMQEKLEALCFLKQYLQNHISKYNMFTDPFYKFYYVQTNILVYQNLLSQQRYREALKQLQFINQIVDENDIQGVVQQFSRFNLLLGVQVDPVQVNKDKNVSYIQDQLNNVYLILCRDGPTMAETHLAQLIQQTQTQNNELFLTYCYLNLNTIYLLQGKILEIDQQFVKKLNQDIYNHYKQKVFDMIM